MKNFKAGNYVTQKGYKSFQPNLINRKWQVDEIEVLKLLDVANREIGKLDMFSEYVPNIDLFIQMHVLKEANQSSKIEGTRTNIEDALLSIEDISDEKKNDWEEVQNYIQALNSAISSLEKLPLSSRLIKNTHKTLLQGVRGEHKQPGEFRTSQNWIGGSSLDKATFIPPHHASIGELMGDLEKLAHSENLPLHLLKIALLHYQFETIHPFLDGNGRVGRLMITLYLVEKEILKKPILYLSDFFERNRIHYYDNLMRVRDNNDLLQWFKFFLEGVIETTKSSRDTFDKILKLQKDIDTKISTLGNRGANIRKTLNFLFQTPLVDAKAIEKHTKLTNRTAYRIIEDLEKLGILREITGASRSKLYIFEDYVSLFR